MKLRLSVKTIIQTLGIVLKQKSQRIARVNVLVKEMWTNNCVCQTLYRGS